MEFDERIISVEDTQPIVICRIIQDGEKSVYLENNTRTIHINKSNMHQLFKEEDFYKDNGWPSERLIYSEYTLNIVKNDYDQFILVENAEYPYIRLSPKRGNHQFPCGGSSVISTDGYFAKMSDAEREKECPKIAWGFAAVYLINLRYDSKQEDYVELKRREIIIKDYYDKYLIMYLENHNGLKYTKLSTEQKELDFIKKHEVIIRGLWEKSTPLSQFPILFEYAQNAEKDYETYLSYRKKEIQKNNMCKKRFFSTEIRETYNKQYVKVYFLDDSIAKDAKEVVERLNVVKTVNITLSKSKDHPGNTLTVYPKSMVEAEDCENEIVDALNKFFSGGGLAERKPVRNDAYFNHIEDEIIKQLDKARVSIHVCIAWFTNQRIADKLVEKRQQGLDVKVVFYNDHTNSKFGVNLKGIPFKAVRGSRGGLMHNKYCIIDNQIVITGSYNWSEKAENKNDENAAVMYDCERASDYSVEFRKMLDSE